MSLSQQTFQNGILWGVLWYMSLQFFNGSRRDMWGGLKSQVTFMFSQGLGFWDDIKMDCLLILATIY